MRPRMILATVGVLTTLSSVPVSASPVVVACGPGQRAVVRESVARGEPVTRVACVGRGYNAIDDRGRYGKRYYERRHRSWGKSALIIGGSTGVGAGIGGAVAGGRGALVGAALGAGASSIYEGAHRR